MIREVCSCGAEFETDVPEQITLIKSWRRTHKHAEKQATQEIKDSTLLTNTEVVLGFQPTYDPLEEE
jgi:hypothetical protein